MQEINKIQDLMLEMRAKLGFVSFSGCRRNRRMFLLEALLESKLPWTPSWTCEASVRWKVTKVITTLE